MHLLQAVIEIKFSVGFISPNYEIKSYNLIDIKDDVSTLQAGQTNLDQVLEDKLKKSR